MRLVKHLLEDKGGAIHAIEPDKPVLEAIRVMADKYIGALLVMRGSQLLGIVMARALAGAGNPSAIHRAGRRARALVDEAREHVAKLVNASVNDVVPRCFVLTEISSTWSKRAGDRHSVVCLTT